VQKPDACITIKATAKAMRIVVSITLLSTEIELGKGMFPTANALSAALL
jgi:uncharacterized cupredoxin-like copper-binding protein